MGIDLIKDNWVSKNFGGLANTLGDHFGGQPMNSGEH